MPIAPIKTARTVSSVNRKKFNQPVYRRLFLKGVMPKMACVEESKNPQDQASQLDELWPQGQE